MRDRTIVLAGLALLALAGMACSFCPLIPGPSGPTGSRPSITLVNNSDETICYVYISPTTSDEWGEDWLGSTEVIDPGDQRVFNVEPGVYDLLATDCDDNEIDIEWEMEVRGPVVWNIP